MEVRTLTETIMKLADRYNTSAANMKNLTIKMCIVCMKYIDKQALWAKLFDEEYIDWDLVNQQKDNILGGITTWITLLDLMNWNHLENHEGEINTHYPILNNLRKQIKEVCLDPGGAEGWTMACKIKILSMVLGLPTLKAIDMFTCNVFKRNTTHECMQLLALQSEVMYTPEEQMTTLYYILHQSKVQVKILEDNLAISKAIKDDTKLSLQMSRMQVVQGRPRLRDRLENPHQRSDSSFNSWETYTGFCYKHQFPPTLSENIKTKLYFMASQVKWDWRAHSHKVAPGATMILAKVAEFPVTQPDVAVLIRVIENMSMEGKSPFNELNQFRSKCFQSFASSQVQKMSLTQFLQLYVAVYQNPSIWKEIWKQLIGVISVQIMKDCESFVLSNKFDEESFMELLCFN
jgi:hypothetical protein